MTGNARSFLARPRGVVEVKAVELETEAQGIEGQSKRRCALRYFSVFNTEQWNLPVSVTEETGASNNGNLIRSPNEKLKTWHQASDPSSHLRLVAEPLFAKIPLQLLLLPPDK